MTRKRRRRKVTITGRVVYDRPKHSFSDADLVRIFRARLHANHDNVGAFLFTHVRTILDVVYAFILEASPDPIQTFVEEVLEPFFQAVFTEAVKYLPKAFTIISSIVNSLIPRQLTDQREVSQP